MSASSFETHFLPEDIGALGEEQVGRHQRVVEQSLGVVAVELGTTHLTATLALMTSRSPGCKVTVHRALRATASRKGYEGGRRSSHGPLQPAP